MVDLSQLAAQQQQAPPPGPNDPGGPPPDPRTLTWRDTPPPPLADLLPQRPVKTSKEPGDQQTDQATGDGGDATQVADASTASGWWRGPQAPQMYIPHQANRAPKEWGSPSWQVTAQQSYDGVLGGSHAPDPTEAYPLISSSGGQLGQWGSPGVAGPSRQAGMMAQRFFPILDMLSSGTFSKNYNAAALGRMKMEQQQMQLQLERAYMAHQQEMLNYGSILHEAATGAITPDEAKYRLEHHIYLNNDQILQEILHNKGLGSAEKFLQWRDAKMNDMLAGGTALRKATGYASSGAAVTAYGEQPGAAGAGSVDYPTLADNIVPGGAPAQPGAQGAPIPPDDDYGSNVQKKYKLNDTEMQDVQSMIDGDVPQRYTDLTKSADPNAPIIQSKMDSAADDMRADIRRAAGSKDDPSLSRGQNIDRKLAAIGNISSQQRSKLAGILNYTTDPKDETTLKGQRSNLIALAKQIDPKYDEGNYQNVHKFSAPGSVENRTLTRTGNVTQNYLRLMGSLNDLSENEKIPKRVLDAWLADHYSGDDKWDKVYGNIRNLAINLNGLQTMTGTPRVTLVHDIVAKMSPTSSPRSIRAQLQNDMIDAYRVVNDYQEQWQNITGRDTLVPGVSPLDYRAMRAIARMNPETGEMPKGSDVPYEVTAVSRDPSQAAKGLSEMQRQTPLTMPQVSQLDQFIKDHTEDADPDIQAQVQEARVRLGAVMGLGERVPAIDTPPNAARR